MTVLIHVLDKCVEKCHSMSVSWGSMLTERACTLCGAHSVLWTRMLRVAVVREPQKRAWKILFWPTVDFLKSNYPSGPRHQAYLWFAANALFAYKTVILNPKICHSQDWTSSCCTILKSVHIVQAWHVKTVCCCYCSLRNLSTELGQALPVHADYLGCMQIYGPRAHCWEKYEKLSAWTNRKHQIRALVPDVFQINQTC